MLKKIVSKFKSLISKKNKTVQLHQKVISHEQKNPEPFQNTLADSSVNEINTNTETRKKETPEEYRLRKEKNLNKKVQTVRPQRLISTDFWDEKEFKVPVVDGKTRFQDLNLEKEVLHAIYDLGFQYCTPVQAETLDKSLKGEDVTAQAQTGTGKTAAFLITIFNHLLKNPLEKKQANGTPRAIILAPTRELVLQIEKDAKTIAKYVPCSILSIFGGIEYKKQQMILQSEPCDILICTPGRLIDYIGQNFVDLSKVEILIIDEADRMLNMGFIPSVRRIVVSTPAKAKRQTLFFTATMTSEVNRLAESWTRQAHKITLTSDEIEVENIQQITYITTIEEKPTLLFNLIMQKNLERVLIFANRRNEARKLKEKLETYGISCSFLSGDVDQKQRISRLEKFREGQVRVLVATDIASRGIHVEGISHVINYNMPSDIEEYIHRIGRTGRAGASGISINFADEEDSHELGKLETYLGKKIECTFPDESLLVEIPDEFKQKVNSATKVKNWNNNKNQNNRNRFNKSNKSSDSYDRKPPKKD